MRSTHLSVFLATALLATTPAISPALAEPAPAAHATRAHAPTLAPRDRAAPAVSDAEQYAAREARDTEAADFRGGVAVVVIGATTATVVLAVLLLLVLL